MTQLFSPLTIALGAGIGLLLVIFMLYARARRRAQRVAKNDSSSLLEGLKNTAGGLVTIILLRGGAPLGKIIPNCEFINGQYTLDPKSPNPQTIIYDGRYVRNNPDGQPFLMYDVEKQSVVAYAGECGNDDDVTLIFHDGNAKDVKAAEADKYRETPNPESGQATVLRKHASLWRRLGGARLYQEKTTSDWDAIQQTQVTWLRILQQYFPIIAIFFFVVLLILGIVVAVKV